MGFNIIKKLFDRNYATRQVEAIRKDTNKKLKHASDSADKVTKAAKEGDVTAALLYLAGGKR